jgi:DNA-binding response OmpR family regulator
MKTSPWNIKPFPTLLFDPDIALAKRRATWLVHAGAPTEIVTSSAAMLESVRKNHFRTLIVAVDLDSADCMAFLDELRLAAPNGWIIAIGPRADEDAHAVAHRHGVDSLVAAPAPPAELFARIAALQLRARPRF